MGQKARFRADGVYIGRYGGGRFEVYYINNTTKLIQFMSFKKEILKAMGVILLFWGTVLYGIIGIINLSTINKTSISSIILTILFVTIYLFFLKNDLDQIKNEYENDMNEHDKQWNKRFVKTQNDLEKRGMTFSGEAVRLLGKRSAYVEGGNTPLSLPKIPKGELETDREDYEKYRTKKHELDFKRAKYKVIINLLKK